MDTTINVEFEHDADNDGDNKLSFTPSEDESTINLLRLKSLMWPTWTRLVIFVSSLSNKAFNDFNELMVNDEKIRAPSEFEK